MSQAPESAENYVPPSDRRSHSRQQVRALAYVKLDEGNGGIVLNLSEGGLSVQAVMSLMDESLPCMRFQLSPSQDWIETAARIVWASDSKKVAGLQFADLPQHQRGQIREWLSQEIIPDRFPKREVTRSNGRGKLAVTPAASESEIAATSHAEPELAAPIPQSVPGPGAAVLSRSAGLVPMIEYAQSLRLGRHGQAALVRTRVANPLRRRWALVALIALFATISLAAGWVAGRDKVNETLQQARKAAWRDAAGAQLAAATPAGPVARVSEIEAVDTSSQGRVIPFNAPSTAPDANRRAEPPHNPPPQSRKARPAFQRWVLSPPRQAQRAADIAGTEKQIPPIPIGVTANAESIARSSALVDPLRPGPPAPQFVPSPKQPTSLIEGGALIRRVEPIYPALAQGQRMEGTVRLRAAIGRDGVVRGVDVISGPGLLVEAAASAVRQWRYSPILLNGKPVGTTKDIEILFRLRDSSN